MKDKGLLVSIRQNLLNISVNSPRKSEIWWVLDTFLRQQLSRPDSWTLNFIGFESHFLYTTAPQKY